MSGLNWVDAVIVIVIIVAIIRGLRDGIVIQLLTCLGFLGGLFLTGWLVPHILPIHDKTLQSIICVNLVLLCALYLAVQGYYFGKKLHYSFGKSRIHSVETLSSVAFSIISVLFVVWLLASVVGRMPFEELSNSVSDAYIVQKLDGELPPVPAFVSSFNQLVDPNTIPKVYIKPYLNSSEGSLVVDSKYSTTGVGSNATVRITGFGCGGVVSGSGFVVAKDVIATNAHVVAGVKRPIVKYHSQSLAGTVIYFDRNLDLAFLRVHKLSVQPLSLETNDIDPTDKKVNVLGYPDGDFTVQPGIIRSSREVFGPDIYGLTMIGREVYEVQVKVAQGSSGGPVLLDNGNVIGMIYAQSDVVDGYGYALTAASLVDPLHHAEHSITQVNTGACLRQ